MTNPHLIFKGKYGYINKIVYNFIVKNHHNNMSDYDVAIAVSQSNYLSHVTPPTAFQAALAIRALRSAGLICHDYV